MAKAGQMGHPVLVPVEVNLAEGWLMLGGPSGSKIKIWGSREPGCDQYGFVSFRVAITGAGLHAESGVLTVEDREPNLRSLFRDLAADWRGLNGDSTWDAVDTTDHRGSPRPVRPCASDLCLAGKLHAKGLAGPSDGAVGSWRGDESSCRRYRPVDSWRLAPRLACRG